MPYAPKVYQDWMKNHLPEDVGVTTDAPATRARRHVALLSAVATGHPKPEQFRWQRIIVWMWANGTASADAETATAELGDDVRTLVLRSKREIAGVHNVVLVGDLGRYDDPDDTAPRFQLTFDALFKQDVPVKLPAAT